MNEIEVRAPRPRRKDGLMDLAMMLLAAPAGAAGPPAAPLLKWAPFAVCTLMSQG